MAKRSPIAGYNHNVRYRGLIFHVQTEDSGQQSPHLFTHMFHGGVIISTRKLVYDAGASEDAIKGLMQSQHKVVLRDLKRGVFDDKIDQYLVGTEGLLPRGGEEGGEKPMVPLAPADEVPRESSPALQVRLSEPEIVLERAERPETDHDITPEMMELDEEPPPPPVIARTATPPPIPSRTTTPQPQPVQARTKTAERRSGPGKVRGATTPPPPPMEELDPPTLTDSKESIAAAIAAAQEHVSNETIRTEALQDSGPSIQIQLELDDSDEIAIELPRKRRGTDVETPDSDGIPGQIGVSVSGRTGGDSIPPLPPPPGRLTGDRVSAVGAATLPPARPISRPATRQSITPPAVVSRPLTHDDIRSRGDSDTVEVYAPPPPTAIDTGGGTERPGQYAQHKRVSQRLPVDVVKGPADRSGSVPIPAGLSRPGRPSQAPANVQGAGSGGIPQRITGEPSQQNQTQPMHTLPARPSTPSPDPYRPVERARTPTPARVSASSPVSSRVPSTSSGGVVMTRPAVIVGAPAKPAGPKVRKAREEEGRGFGQGLISEKSLDEVILAYLSEDADEK